MPLTASSQAPAVGASVNNVQLASAAEVLARKMVIIGTYDPAITTITDEVPAFVSSPEEVGATYGRGFMLHRLAVAASLGSNKSEMWVVPQAEAGGAAASTGTVTVTGTATAAGTLSLYVAGIAVPVTVTSGDTATAIATAIVTAVTANNDLPVTATSALGVVTFTAKSKGPWGDNISLTFDWGFQEAHPAGVSTAVVAMSGGSGIPTIADALTGLGTGDNANSNHFTELCHGYGQDSTTLTAISAYNGDGNDPVGLYSKTIARPFRSLVGDTVAGSSGLSGLVSLADGRKSDRTSGVIAVPGSPNMPDEIAAQTLGVMQRINANRAEQGYLGQILTGVIAGADANDWTSSYASRDTAVQGGISPTKVSGGAVKLQAVLTFYRPDSIPASSNGYKSQRNISIIQNVLNSLKVNFEQEKWQGTSLVADVSKVTNIIDRQKARDTQAVLDDLIGLVRDWEGKAWLYNVDGYTIPNLAVQIRSGMNGFDTVIPLIFSIEGLIFDNVVNFDTAITVLL